MTASVRLKDQKRILADATLELMKQSQTPDTLQGRYGFGWIPIPDDNGCPAVAHAGGMPGVATVLVLYPAEDVAIAVLTNRESGLPGRLAGEIAEILLPRYGKTKRAREANEQPVQAAPFHPAAELLGEWKGAVRTYSGTIPLALTIKSDGDAHVTLGDELPTVLSSVEFERGELSGVFSGQIPTADAKGFPRVLLRLHLRGDVLSGMARAQDVAPRIVGGLPSYVQLEKISPMMRRGCDVRSALLVSDSYPLGRDFLERRIQWQPSRLRRPKAAIFGS